MNPVPDSRAADSAPTRSVRAADTDCRKRDSDLRDWLDEWRWWLGGVVILSAIWGLQVLRTGVRYYWPAGPLGVWAAVLVAIAIWPRSSGT